MAKPKKAINRPLAGALLKARRRHPNRAQYAQASEYFEHWVQEFGPDHLKALVNRKPKPKNPGRPIFWDQYRLFTIWLIVQAIMQLGNLKTDPACKLLESAGGILEDDEEKSLGNLHRCGELSGDYFT